MTTQQNIVATFEKPVDADKAIEELEQRGVAHEHISVLFNEDTHKKHFEKNDTDNKAAEGVGWGAALGGLLTSLTALAIPGSVFAAGPLAAVLASGGAGGATGGIVGGLVGSGIKEDQARHVENDINHGRVAIAVHSMNPEQEQFVTQVLSHHAAQIH